MQRSLQRLDVVGREQFHAPHKLNVDGVNRGTTLSGVQLRAPREEKVDDAGVSPVTEWLILERHNLSAPQDSLQRTRRRRLYRFRGFIDQAGAFTSRATNSTDPVSVSEPDCISAYCFSSNG